MTKKKINRIGKGTIRYPKTILAPVAGFLRNSLKLLERRKRVLDKEDPFKNGSRIDDNASPDADAEEQFGHFRVSAVKAQIDKKIIQTRKALTYIRLGKYGICDDCGNMIDTDRLIAFPEATLCVKCERKREK